MLTEAVVILSEHLTPSLSQCCTSQTHDASRLPTWPSVGAV